MLLPETSLLDAETAALLPIVDDLRQRIVLVFEVRSVRRQFFWDNRLFELTEALVHQGYHFMLPPLGEASGVV